MLPTSKSDYIAVEKGDLILKHAEFGVVRLVNNDREAEQRNQKRSMDFGQPFPTFLVSLKITTILRLITYIQVHECDEH